VPGPQRRLRRSWATAARLSLPPLLRNAVLPVYVYATLTESLTISLAILWLAAVVTLSQPQALARSLRLWAPRGSSPAW
jgi:hypothetical protein